MNNAASTVHIQAQQAVVDSLYTEVYRQQELIEEMMRRHFRVWPKPLQPLQKRWLRWRGYSVNITATGLVLPERQFARLMKGNREIDRVWFIEKP